MQINNYIEVFLEMMAAERAASPNTIESYRRDLQQAAEHFSGKPVTDISTEDIRKYISVISKSFAKTSVSRKTSALKQFFVFLKGEKEIKENPARLIEVPKKDKLLPNFLTPVEIEAIITAAQQEGTINSLRIKALIEILSGSGLRVSEIISLKKSDVQSAEVNGEKHHFLLVKGKGEKERIAPLTKNAVNAINEYLPFLENFQTEKQRLKLERLGGDSWLFPSRAGSGHITRQQVANLLKKYALMAGLNAERVSPHVLRHSFATNILEKGIDLRVLQEVLGHSDISTTQVYTHINSARMRDFVQKNHPLARKLPK